ncbi:MAG TPA: hypothetical protein PK054_13015 [Anaerohalosphaeraceae bacterium]|nr:hypothetical protein [Anaerohalosphaeraceae bacterium]
MKQYEAVIAALEQLGGYATLGELYAATLKIPGVKWGTKTPCASIRRIVQEHEEFFKIRPGLWALKKYKDRLPVPLQAAGKAGKDTEERRRFDHTYYQGLLVQLGNWKNYITYVPAQDKNRRFLEKQTLGSMAGQTEIPSFTYPDIVNRVKSVDVIWFNHRKLPKAVFEVEHSTDLKNSLIKYVELADFRTEMTIVADVHRKREFEEVLHSRAFEPIARYVRFWSYQDLSASYEKQSALSAFDFPNFS